MDTIFLNEFKAKTIIGIYPWERKVKQTIQIDLEIALPSSLACQSDNIKDALDYALVTKRINEILANKKFSLLEALAEHIAQTILVEFNSPWIKISITKLGIIPGIKKVGVCIKREQTPS